MLGRNGNGCRSLSTLRDAKRQRTSPQVTANRKWQNWPECSSPYNLYDSRNSTPKMGRLSANPAHGNERKGDAGIGTWTYLLPQRGRIIMVGVLDGTVGPKAQAQTGGGGKYEH